MAKTVTTRLDDKYVNRIDELAAKKGIDRSALMRLFLINSLEEHMVRESLEDYKAGMLTLWEAARNCNMTLWEMIRKIEKAHIYTSYDLKALKNDLKTLNG